MSSKEYDTFQPIPSQAERDLSFMDASFEITDFSNSKHLRTTKKLRRRPWFGYKMNMTGRTLQAVSTAVVALTGFIFGLWVLGIPLKSSNIYLLFRYGYIGQNQGVQLIQSNGFMLEGPDNQHFFKIHGQLFNFEKEFIQPKDFILNLYTPDRQLLDRFQFSCCKTEFFPNRITNVEETFPISSGQTGYFELKIL